MPHNQHSQVTQVQAEREHLDSEVIPDANAYAYLDISRPVVAWNVCRSVLASPSRVVQGALSIWQTGYLENLAVTGRVSPMFALEMQLEEVRRLHFPDSPSRLASLYMFNCIQCALEASAWGSKFATENLAGLFVSEDANVSQHDAEWITHGNRPDDWMFRYWRGEQRDSKPIWEMLVDGKANVLGTALRTRAWHNIANEWPGALRLLDLARIAAELGYDIGLITAYATRNDDVLKVGHIVNVGKIDDPAFLETFSAYEGPRNVGPPRDGEPLWTLPDLRNVEFELRV